MTHVATLICNPTTPTLDDALVARVRAILPSAGDTTWLAPGVAADILFAPPPSTELRVHEIAVRTALNGCPVDVVIQPTHPRRKRLFLADMDSTMIGQECIDELADFVGLKAHVSAITERAMRGEIAFEPALRERVALLKGLSASVIDDVIAGRITLMPGGRALVQTMRAHGAYTCLVSGGFTVFTSKIAATLGFDEQRGNTLLVENDQFAGQVSEPILGSEAKKATLLELRARLRLGAAETLAVGDGANDIPMLQEAGLGVAYRAKPKTAEAAGARIDHGDLTALLYTQGYRQSEFVE